PATALTRDPLHCCPRAGVRACTRFPARSNTSDEHSRAAGHLPLKGGGRPPSAAEAVGWGSMSDEVSPTRLASLGDLPLSGGGNVPRCLCIPSPSELAEMCASPSACARTTGERFCPVASLVLSPTTHDPRTPARLLVRPAPSRGWPRRHLSRQC